MGINDDEEPRILFEFLVTEIKDKPAQKTSPRGTGAGVDFDEKKKKQKTSGEKSYMAPIHNTKDDKR